MAAKEGGLAALWSQEFERVPERPRGTGWLVSPREMLRVWRLRRQYRADLLRLLQVGPYLIDDIGLSFREAVEEVRKPFWRG